MELRSAFLAAPSELGNPQTTRVPHSHRDDCCCDPLELKPEPRMNTGDVTDSCTEPKKLVLDLLLDGIFVPILLKGRDIDGYQERDIRRALRVAVEEQYGPE